MQLYIYSLFRFLSDTTAQASCDPGTTCDTGLPTVQAGKTQLDQVLSIVFGVFAAIAVLMVILGGLRYITSQGNPQEVAKARDTIIFAGIGLVIAVSAEAIVFFVVGRL